MLFLFQTSILIHRTVCSNIQMNMYNLKTKPQVFRSVFWSFFLVEMRREERCECTLTGFACSSFSCLKSVVSCQYQKAQMEKWLLTRCNED